MASWLMEGETRPGKEGPAAGGPCHNPQVSVPAPARSPGAPATAVPRPPRDSRGGRRAPRQDTPLLLHGKSGPWMQSAPGTTKSPDLLLLSGEGPRHSGPWKEASVGPL